MQKASFIQIDCHAEIDSNDPISRAFAVKPCGEGSFFMRAVWQRRERSR